MSNDGKMKRTKHGSLLSLFASRQGMGPESYVVKIMPQPDGNLVVGVVYLEKEYNYKYALVRCNSQGQLIVDFGNDGKIDNLAGDITIMEDSRMLETTGGTGVNDGKVKLTVRLPNGKIAPQPGTYTLTATPYSGADGKGTAGTPHTITFTIVEKLTLSHFSLVNAKNSSTISRLQHGAVIDLAKTPLINIRANAGVGYTESVRFGVNSNANYRVESSSPFALASDNRGAYSNWKVQPGLYTITATPFSRNFAEGKSGTPLSITIHIINSRQQQTSIVQSSRNQPKEAASEGLLLSTYPNPVSHSALIQFRVPQSSHVSLTLVDATGKMVQQVFSGKVDAGVPYRINLLASGLATGIYFCRLITAEGETMVNKIIKQ